MSNIDPTKPTEGQATTQSVRDNFSAAATEIDANAAGIAAVSPGGAQAFAAYLDGYLDDGFSEGVGAGDLDTLLSNSRFNFNSAVASNAPSDMTGFGFVETMMGGDTTACVQVIWGQTGADVQKIWMRSRLSSIWGAWKLVVDGNILTFNALSANMVLPTSAAGLASGDLWNNAGVVNIVP